jgi:hypothetical protein
MSLEDRLHKGVVFSGTYTSISQLHGRSIGGSPTSKSIVALKAIWKSFGRIEHPSKIAMLHRDVWGMITSVVSWPWHLDQKCLPKRR